MSDIAVTVLGILQRDDEYLLQRLTEPDGESFYRPIGGGVEFGERSADALEREFREELDCHITAGPTIGTLENRFEWVGEPAHELLIFRKAMFDDESLYDRERFDGIDAGGAVEYEATWKQLDELVAGSEPLYPPALPGLLRGDRGVGHGHVGDP